MSVQNLSKGNAIIGKVLADASGVGVPDLVVAALDFDQFRFLDFERRDVRDPDAERFRDIAAEEGGVAAAIASMESAPDDERGHLQRLGSVITGEDGGFVLTYDEDLFDEGAEQRSRDARLDIILLVLAPDRPTASGGGRYLSGRLMYYSRPFQFESGRTESFVIRIPEERLSQFGVTVRDRNGESVDPTTFYDDNLRLAQQRTARLEATASLIEQFELPRLQLEQRAFDHLLPGLLPSANRSIKSFAGLAPPKSAINNRIWDLITDIDWLVLTGQPRTGRVFLTKKNISKLGTSEAETAGTGTKIDFADLLGLLGYSSGPYRNRHLLSQVELRRALASLAAAPAAPPDAEPTAAPDTATEETLRSSVLGRLQEQTNGLARTPGNVDPAADLSRVRQVVEQLEQSSGIGNAAATHDVDVLQVAFEPLWTAAFDQRFVSKAKALYRATVKQDGTSLLKGAVPAWEDIENVAQLRELISGILGAAEGASTHAFGGLGGISDAANSVRASSDQVAHAAGGVGKLALDLAAALAQPYSFEYFVPGSVNYGIMQTYRQEWKPVSYQVGRVVDAIPLTPGETQTSKLTLTVKRRRKTNSRESSSIKRNEEATVISRTEIEAMEKTALAMSMQTSFQGSFNVGIGSIGSTATFGLNQNQESQRIHKSFAEITRKASQEVRRETEVQYEVEVTDESLSETTRTLRNTNDEMTVTYVFYELERRYRVASQLYGVQPVVLVALPVPAPHEIDDAWILEHAWVIRDALLDSRFEEALDILENTRSQDDAQVAILRANYDAAFAIRKKADREFERLAQLAKTQREQAIGLGVEEKIADVGKMDSGERIATAVFTGGISELFGGGQSNQDDILRAKREAVEKVLEYLDKEIAAVAETRDRAVSTLNEAADKYSAALAAKAMADQKLLQLRLHVRGNLFHYLHQIWKQRDPDDLFFSLHDLEVPFLQPSLGECRLRAPRPDEQDADVPGVVIGGSPYMVDIFPASKVPDPAKLPKKRLAEIADVDRPLGFKGNFVIFPLKVGSLLTDFMTVGFLDGYYGVRDPAMDASYSAGDLMEYARTVWHDDLVALSEEEREKLTTLVLDAGMRNPGYETEVVLPTGKVWVEALKGGQALLEPFKQAHRGLDVLKVEEEVRRERIENLRRIQRIGLEKALLDDPDIEKTTIVRGIESGFVLDPDQ